MIQKRGEFLTITDRSLTSPVKKALEKKNLPFRISGCTGPYFIGFKERAYTGLGVSNVELNQFGFLPNGYIYVNLKF